jgi:hypothetical protein
MTAAVAIPDIKYKRYKLCTPRVALAEGLAPRTPQAWSKLEGSHIPRPALVSVPAPTRAVGTGGIASQHTWRHVAQLLRQQLRLRMAGNIAILKVVNGFASLPCTARGSQLMHQRPPNQRILSINNLIRSSWASTPPCVCLPGRKVGRLMIFHKTSHVPKQVIVLYQRAVMRASPACVERRLAQRQRACANVCQRWAPENGAPRA